MIHSNTQLNHGQTVRFPKKQNVVKRPKPGYCFNCGEDGHVFSTVYRKEFGPLLVARKWKELLEKKQEAIRTCVLRSI